MQFIKKMPSKIKIEFIYTEQKLPVGISRYTIKAFLIN